MMEKTITTNWFGYKGKIPSVIQGMIYGLAIVMIVPWLGEFFSLYWDWVYHVWH